MSANHKLTALIKGRTISGTGTTGEVMTVSFSDGSKMTIRTAGATNTGPTGGTVKSVRQAGSELSIDFEGQPTLTIPTAEETSCVMVRDKSGVMEYAD